MERVWVGVAAAAVFVLGAMPGPATAQPVRARVVEVTGGSVVIDRGTGHGFTRGAGAEIATHDGSVVVRVQSASPDSARLQRPFGVPITVGAAVRLTGAAATAKRGVPPRLSYLGIEGRIAGLVALGETEGGALLGELRMRYRARVPLALSLRLGPVGVAFGSESFGVGHAEVGVSYDHRIFEFGATVGATASEVDDDDSGLLSESLGTSTGVFFRLGARDGFYFEAGMTYSYTVNGFEWVLARFDGSIPLGFGRWLVLTATGGRTRFGIGSIGLRLLLRGGGGPGSLFLTPYFGGGGFFDRDDTTFFDDIRGPAGLLFGLGLERRY